MHLSMKALRVVLRGVRVCLCSPPVFDWCIKFHLSRNEHILVWRARFPRAKDNFLT